MTKQSAKKIAQIEAPKEQKQFTAKMKGAGDIDKELAIEALKTRAAEQGFELSDISMEEAYEVYEDQNNYRMVALGTKN